MENKLSVKEILGRSAVFWIVGQLPCLVLSVESLYVLVHSKYWCKITPRYFKVEGKFIFFPFILKCKCLVIILCIWLKITISVLLVFKLILFALSHCTRRAKSWNCTRSAKSWFIKEFVSFSDLFINSRLVSSAKWCTLLDITDRYKSLINMINRRRSSTDPWGNPWVISWKFQSCYTCVLLPVC